MFLICKNNILNKDIFGVVTNITVGKKYNVNICTNDNDVLYYYDDENKISLLYKDNYSLESIYINKISEVFFSIEEYRDLKLNTIIDE